MKDNKIYNGNIFYKYTRKSLLANKSRTLVTIIGIILSMALLTAVIEGAYSGMEYLKNVEIVQNGCWEGFFPELTDEQVRELKDTKEISKVATMKTAGWAYVGGDNEFKPYVTVQEIDADLPELAGVHLAEGRLPENPDEIALPMHMKTNGGFYYEIGQSITFDLGSRVIADNASGDPASFAGDPGDELGIYDMLIDNVTEKITDSEPRTFTLVGYYERLSWMLEPFSCPGFFALTVSGSGEEQAAESEEADSSAYSIALFTLNNPRSFYSFMKNQDISDTWEVHEDLMNFYGVSGNFGINQMLYGLVAVLVVLIVFGSVTLIYNSFSISVSERTKQFGILKSVGATKKQIRKTVFYEAAVLAGIGIIGGAIVGCAGIGITLWALSGSFARLTPDAGGVRMKLVISPVMLIIAALLCLITVFISAMIPAQRAIRIAPIDSIRQSRDINIKGKRVRTSKLRAKLFGFEGVMAAKNFKRSRKRTRSVIISLLLSLVLFISASSFCAYLTRSIERFTVSAAGADIHVSIASKQEGGMTALRFLESVRTTEGVDEAALACFNTVSAVIPEDKLSEDGRSDPNYLGSVKGSALMNIYTVFIDDTTFRQLIDKYDLDEKDYFNTEDPCGIFFNKDNYYQYEEKTDSNKYYTRYVLDETKLPFTLDIYQAEYMEGYYEPYISIDEESGLVFFNYQSEGGMNVAEDGSMFVRTDELKTIDASECSVKTALKAPAVITEYEYWMPSVSPAIIFPMSMHDTLVIPDRALGMQENNVCYVIAEKHALANDNLKTLLEDSKLGGSVYDIAEQFEMERLLVRVVNVFAYGFIILISLIAVANVFNTISTNISLRRREFAMLRSVGMAERGFRKMMNYECLIYGLRGLLWGLPLAVLFTYAIYRITNIAYDLSFFIPWYSILIAVCSVFAVVFIAMWYAAGKIRGDNPVDALKNENL